MQIARTCKDGHGCLVHVRHKVVVRNCMLVGCIRLRHLAGEWGPRFNRKCVQTHVIWRQVENPTKLIEPRAEALSR